LKSETKQQGLTKHNLLDLTFGTKQQKQNNTKLEGNEKIPFAPLSFVSLC
jgi:hypothetical protein